MISDPSSTSRSNVISSRATRFNERVIVYFILSRLALSLSASISISLTFHLVSTQPIRRRVFRARPPTHGEFPRALVTQQLQALHDEWFWLIRRVQPQIKVFGHNNDNPMNKVFVSIDFFPPLSTPTSENTYFTDLKQTAKRQTDERPH